MAYTLKASGVATNLLLAFGVDENGTTIKEFVNGWTIGSGMTQTGTVSTGTSTWNGHANTPYMIFSGSNRLNITAPINVSGEIGFICVFRSGNDASGSGLSGNTSDGIEISATAAGLWRLRDPSSTASNLITGVTSTRAYSFCLNTQVSNATSYYALEGNTASGVDNTLVSPGGALTSDAAIHNIGQVTGAGLSYVCDLIGLYIKNSAFTQTEFNDIHSDPIATLFDASGGGGGAKPGAYYSQMRLRR